jgi:hypothetical protein
LSYLEWYENRLLEIADDTFSSVLSQDDRLEALETTASWEDYEMSWHEVKPEPVSVLSGVK